MTQRASRHRVQLLAVLGSIQLALAADSIPAAEALLPQAEALLASFEEAPPATVPDAAENAAGRPALAVGRAALRLQHRVLRVCALLAAGRTGPLALQKPGAACGAINGSQTVRLLGTFYSKWVAAATTVGSRL